MNIFRKALGFIALVVFVNVITMGFALRAYAFEEKKDSDEQFHIVYDHSVAAEYLNRWRLAFEARDAKTLENLMSEKADASIKSDDFGWDSKTGVFGWSSPWPIDSRILECGDGKATIMYYAFVSDPHISVWREEIEYHIEITDVGEAVFTVEKEKLEMFEEISDMDSFLRAYPDGIIENTGIDYFSNEDLLVGLFWAAEEHANDKTDDFAYYKSLYSPDSAVVSLLNLSNDPKLITVSSETDKKTQETIARIKFIKEKKEIAVQMKQVYGDQGLWLPQDVTGEKKEDPADGISDDAAYAAVLKNYQNAEGKKWAPKDYWENGVSSLIDQVGAKSLKYAYMDLNGDGLSELLILDNGKNARDPYYLYALYSRKGTRILPVAVCSHFSLDAGIHLANNGTINDHGYGTGYYQDAYCYLDDKNDYTLSPLIIVTQDCSDYTNVEDPDECWYMSTKWGSIFCGPIWDEMEDEFTHIKKEDADGIIEAFRFMGSVDKKDIIS